MKKSALSHLNRLERAERADLVTFGHGIDAAVCTNCMYVDPEKDHCNHPLVDQVLKSGADRMCCSFWDRPGTKREWEKK